MSKLSHQLFTSNPSQVIIILFKSSVTSQVLMSLTD